MKPNPKILLVTAIVSAVVALLLNAGHTGLAVLYVVCLAMLLALYVNASL